MLDLARELFALAAFASAVVFGLGGIVGLHRYADPYARMQASSLCGTTSVFSMFIGALALAETVEVAARLIVIIAFFLVSSPTGSHIVARFAWNSGIDPWRPEPKRRRRVKPKQAGTGGGDDASFPGGA